jgi:AraC-like DNA-binding protein
MEQAPGVLMSERLKFVSVETFRGQVATISRKNSIEGLLSCYEAVNSRAGCDGYKRNIHRTRRNDLEIVPRQDCTKLWIERLVLGSGRSMSTHRESATVIDINAAGISLTADQLRPEHEAFTSRREVMAPWQARCVQGYIAANLHSTIRVMDLIRMMKFCPNRFGRVFKETFGCTPHQYIIGKRIERAKSLMLMSKDTLAQIAAECGFVNQSHLSNLFRKIVGVSPSWWRQTHASPRL